jgi:type IV pilus assembly protein PilN
MNISLNLATRPYIELRAVYSRLRLFAIVLAVAAVPLLLALKVEEHKAHLAEGRVQALQQNIAALRQQQTRARALLIQGPNANVLAEAVFLNRLFRHKGFSWTATMSDLETTLPVGVQVGGIEPIVAPDGRVTIRLRVIGARDRTVEVIRNLEHSRHFIAPRLIAEGLADQNGTRAKAIAASGAPEQVGFDILADYRPLPNPHDGAGVVAEKAEARAGNDTEQALPEAETPQETRRSRGHAAKPAAGVAASQGGR